MLHTQVVEGVELNGGLDALPGHRGTDLHSQQHEGGDQRAPGAVVPQVGSGNVRLFMHRSEAEVEEADYRLRVVAVNEAPEHAGQMIDAGDAFRREFIDPPLDLDVFAVDFEDGDRFFVELETGGDDPQLTMGVLPPAGASFYAFIAAGPERARSEVFQTDVDGQHLLIVYSTGLSPDVEQSYRFRVVETSEPASVVLK